MNDYLVKALAFDGTIRAYAATTTEAVGEMQRRHYSWPTATAAIGRTMTATVMMGAMTNDGDKITVKIEGGGPLGAIVADADANGNIRGYAINPQTHFDLNENGKLDVRRAVGTEGMLTIVKDLGLRDMFTGQIPLVSGEIAEDFTQYFAISEQTPSAVALGVLVNPDNTVKASGGFIFQVLPGVEDETITELERCINGMEPISTMIDRGLSPEELLEEVLGKENVRVIDKKDVKFSCNCSKERFGTAIKSLGETEIQTMIAEDGQATAECHFCLETYEFSKEELEDFVEEIRSES